MWPGQPLRQASGAWPRRLTPTTELDWLDASAGSVRQDDPAFPGPLRDQLVAAVLAGTKTTTSGLVADYEHEGSPLPPPGLRQAVIDSAGNRVAVIETTAVRVIRLGEVDLAHVWQG